MDLLTTYTHHSELQVITALFGNLNTTQITTAPAKHFPACCVFISRSLSAVSNSEDSSASLAQVPS
jgi:hypothetical protein